MPTFSLSSCGCSPAAVSRLIISTGTFPVGVLPRQCVEGEETHLLSPREARDNARVDAIDHCAGAGEDCAVAEDGDAVGQSRKHAVNDAFDAALRAQSPGKRHRRFPPPSGGPNSSALDAPSPCFSRNRTNASVSGDAPTRRMFIIKRIDRKYIHSGEHLRLAAMICAGSPRSTTGRL